MPISASIDPVRQRWMIVVTGEVTLAEFQAMAAEQTSHPAFDPAGEQLMDLTGATGKALTTAEIRTLVAESPFRPGARRAYVATSPEVYGLVRMFQNLSAEKAGSIGVFSSIEEAERWLDQAGPV